MAEDLDRIEREVRIAAPVERVWEVVSEPAHIGRWFSEFASGDNRVGGTLTIGWQEHGTYTVVVERAERPHVFAYRGAVSPGEEAHAGNSTLVEFTLTADGDGTLLRVVESGFASLDLPEEQQRKQRDGNVEGWSVQGENLRRYAEQP